MPVTPARTWLKPEVCQFKKRKMRKRRGKRRKEKNSQESSLVGWCVDGGSVDKTLTM